MLDHQIPERYRLAQFNEGIPFFVIIATNLLMMTGLVASDRRLPESAERRCL